MKTWNTETVTVEEVAHDFDLHAFEVYKDGELLGKIYPGSIEDMKYLIADLDAGACPVRDQWEDGLGNTCGVEPWGEAV